MFKTFKKSIATMTLASILIGSFVFSLNNPVFADQTKTYQRFAGDSRYETAVEISGKNWFEAYNVVLARGDSFPDALAGAVLANSPVAGGPLLLTESNKLRPEVLQEMQRLHTNSVFILGGTNAISADVEKNLNDNGIKTYRIQGSDRYETAANIAATALENSSKAFLASGKSYADALSISSYAAAKGIPLLLTDNNKVPEATLNTLKKLGVTDVTLIGGESAIGKPVADQLANAGYGVTRLSGSDRFQTNVAILNNLQFDCNRLIVATGLAFPDALAGSVLAARENNPILLVPDDENTIPGSPTASYLDNNRANINHFMILGGWSVINYKVENIVRTGKVNPRVSLQFWDGYASKDTYESQLSYVPGNFTDYIDILVPNFAGVLQDDGSFTYSFSSADTPKYLVSLGQSKGARVVPMVKGNGATANLMLMDPAKRRTFADSAVKMVQETNADGILVDFEVLDDNTQTGLTSLMQDIYSRLHAKGKLVLISVMSKTSATNESWYDEYNYKELGKCTDYVQIMSYDKHYSTSEPGPIAPLDWVRQVMAYAVTEIPSEKILMGLPYYGRAWKTQGSGWVSKAFGWAVATQTATQAGARITRETTLTDPIGIPTFTYTDEDGSPRTVYFDDRLSWGAKLGLLDDFSLGGIGGWSLGWVNEISAPELFPLLKERMQ
ncbi:MAG: N-acetylmuramoyl-L-alanine amidase LytC [Candidatus Dichloromethanomonas elyunquensis]|nr:MAG: N-acetylmuramoyl-L-alanine amidase LytC [Candidatus Dichloromethanomonas elyunquensis]